MAKTLGSSIRAAKTSAVVLPDNHKLVKEQTVVSRFLDAGSQHSFADLFNVFRPQLEAFFRSRSCDLALAEDLAQEVMLIVYRKATQLRDRNLFRAWLFSIARNALWRHFRKQTREAETVYFANIPDRSIAPGQKSAGRPGFEFLRWMMLLDSREREVMTLRFIEHWEYHEIAEAKAIPIGTVQWRVFNAKRKLALHLAAC
jgi:RNA polymerase sigma-70 factor (ECF subfamily)